MSHHHLPELDNENRHMRQFTVRCARESDNGGLVELDRRCTMGEETTLAFDRSPDFFARSEPYEQHTLLVAEAGDAVVGVGGVALKRLRVAGEQLKAAYLYDLRVDPAFRRLGVASAIGDALRGLVKQVEADFTYALVLEGNVPSLELVAKRGHRPVRRWRPLSPPLSGSKWLAPSSPWRRASPSSHRPLRHRPLLASSGQ